MKLILRVILDDFSLKVGDTCALSKPSLNADWNRLFTQKIREASKNENLLKSSEKKTKMKRSLKVLKPKRKTVIEKVKDIEENNVEAELYKTCRKKSEISEVQKSMKKTPKLRKIAVKNSPKTPKMKNLKSKRLKENTKP